MQPGADFAIIDLFGKGGHIRSVLVPDWVKSGIDRWTAAAQIESGSLFVVSQSAEEYGEKDHRRGNLARCSQIRNTQ